MVGKKARNSFHLKGFSCVYGCSDSGYLISNRVHLTIDEAIEFGLSTENGKNLIGIVGVRKVVLTDQVRYYRRGQHDGSLDEPPDTSP